jgi:hypothetical protein
MNKLLSTVAILALLGAAPSFAQQAAPPPAAGPVETAAQAPLAPPPLTAEQLDALCGPVALYPDALLAQILIASAYPLDVTQAARWVEANKDKKLTPEATDAAIKAKAWDPSVKALVQFPTVLKQLDQNLEWTSSLGDAFVNQQEDVMQSIQRLREQAKAAGNLATSKEQTVTVTTDNNITIEPTDPQTIYVPQYTPAVYEAAPAQPAATTETTTVVMAPAETTYAPPAYDTAYPYPYPYPYPAYSSGAVVATGLLSFGAGMVTGAILADNINWNNNHVYHYGNGDYGWGGNNCNNCGNRGSNNNVNIGEINVNSGNRAGAANGQPWQPNQQRRATQGTTRAATTRPAATTTAAGRGYGAGGAKPKPTASSVQAALGQGGGGAFDAGKGSDARRASDRGQQSRQNAQAQPRPAGQGQRAGQGNVQAGQGQRAGQAKPAGGGAGNLQRPAARPAQPNAGMAQQRPAANRAQGQGYGGAGGGNAYNAGANRGGGNAYNAGANRGGGNSAYNVGNGNSTRAASQRGQGSRQSAAQFQPRGGGGGRGGGGRGR